MKYLKIAILWLALIATPNLLVLRMAQFAFTNESHQLYSRIDQLLQDHETYQNNRLATVSRLERQLVSHEGRILEEVDKRIAFAIQKHERTHEGKQ